MNVASDAARNYADQFCADLAQAYCARRRELDLSRYAVAKAMGVKVDTVIRVERQTHGMNLHTAAMFGWVLYEGMEGAILWRRAAPVLVE